MTNPASSPAYLQQPSLHGDRIVFISDDDLWTVSCLGGLARRLTTSRGRVSSPHFSPDGDQLAYLSNDHDQWDIHLIPAEGGIPQRVTYSGVQRLSGWKDSHTLIYASDAETFSPRIVELYELNLKTGESRAFNYGHASCLHFEGKKSVLGRNVGDPARWKRYRGGTAGTLWVDNSGRGQFRQILKKLPTNLANPLWIEGRIYFISDHEGVGNIYSCSPQGTHLKRHSHCGEYYVRSFSHHQGVIVYQSGGDLFQLELVSGRAELLSIEVNSGFTQALPRYESASKHLQNFTLSPDGDQLTLLTRGQLFAFKPWGGAPFKLGVEHRRYRKPCYVRDKRGKTYLMAMELDHQSEERFKLFDGKTFKARSPSPRLDIGKVHNVYPSEKGGHVAITNNRSELWLFNISTQQFKKIDRDPNHYIEKCSWSPCGRYLAYAISLGGGLTSTQKGMVLYDVQRKQKRNLVQPVLVDSDPVFDPTGHYLYFIGLREFHPHYCETHFELGFPFATKPYALVLAKDTPDPMQIFLDFDKEDEGENPPPPKTKPQAPQRTKIDWEGLESRIVSLPFPMGGHLDIEATENKIFFFRQGHQGIDPHSRSMEDKESLPDLYAYDLKEKKEEVFQESVETGKLSLGGKYWALICDDNLRICAAKGKPTEGEDKNKIDGWVDVDKVKVHIHPKEEWRQMYQEAWILQREHFWSADMSQVDWKKVYQRYLPLLDKVHTRYEFSDLMWEMQGELGTSHCYEFAGDYHRSPPHHPVGKLAAKFKWDRRKKAMVIEEVAKGDSWIPTSCSPLTAPAVSLKTGDFILGVEGRPLENLQSLSMALESRANEKVHLLVQRKGQTKREQVLVQPLSGNSLTRYRDWVEGNKNYVHKKSRGKLGYVHIPNMAAWGFSEFYRHFLTEHRREGLVIDVRYNGGGHVSQHLLKILAQKVVGFDQTRYWGVEPYPTYGINGPLVCLTNEFAGSDGDIFSHSFKLMKLGPLIGKRTWGGVVGIWPRFRLNDGTYTSQPEFSFWFKDVGWSVENYGTDPDIEVDILPQDWAQGKDPQLDKSIEVLLKELKKNPPLKPNLKANKPSLKLPQLPK